MNTVDNEILESLKDVKTEDLQWIYNNLNIDPENDQYSFGYTPISQRPTDQVILDNFNWLFESIFITFSDEDKELYTYEAINKKGELVTKYVHVFSFIDFSSKKHDRFKEKKIYYSQLCGYKSRYDFNKERDLHSTSPIWDNSHVNTIKAGYLFMFAHDSTQEKELAELHYVESADNEQPRRPWWNKAERDVLTLSEEFITLPLPLIKSWIVVRENVKMSPKNRLQGTCRAKFNLHLKFTIQFELSRRNQTLQELEARIWNVNNTPIDQDIFNITQDIANQINDSVGSTKIYQNQIKNAAVCSQILLDQDSYQQVILGADTQSGKSGSSELLAQSFRKVLVAKGEINEDDKVGCLFILHISDSNLRDQTKDRLSGDVHGSFVEFKGSIYKSTIDEKVFASIEMLSGGAIDRISKAYEELIVEYKCKKVLLISDEIQSAMTVGQQISGIYEKLGLNVGNNNVYIAGTTATPTRYYNQTSSKKPLTIYWGDNGSCYYGVEDMLTDGKLHNLGKITDDLLKCHAEKYLEPNKYLLVRDNGAKKVFWEDFAKEHNIEIKHFNCSEGNISTLNKQLKRPPLFWEKTNMILMVKMAARAGNTIECFEHVSVMFDSFSGDEPIVQSFPGRCSGNQVNRRAHCPDIFTNIPKIEQYLFERKAIKGGVLPSVTAKGNISKAKIKNPAVFKCVSINSQEFKDHQAMLLREYNEPLLNNNCDEQNKNLAKQALALKHNEPFRTVAIKNKRGPWLKHAKDISLLTKQYPDLLNQTEEFVLIATNVIQSTGRKLGTSVLQNK